MFDVSTLGETLIDFAQIAVDPAGYPTMAANPGGAVVNYICTLAKFGLRTRLISRVGDDRFGQLLTATVQSYGVDASCIYKDPGAFTTLAFVTFTPQGERSFAFARKPGADTRIDAAHLPLDLGQEKIFHFGTLSLTHEPARTATLEAVSRARRGGALISLDPNLRLPLWETPEKARLALQDAVKLADIIKISDDEVEFLFGTDPQSGAKLLHGFGARLVYVTMGAKGCLYSLDDTIKGLVAGLLGLPTIDTTGAGDIFGGAAAYKLLEKFAAGHSFDTLQQQDLHEITSFANVAAGLSTTRRGGAPSIPDLHEIAYYMGGAPR